MSTSIGDSDIFLVVRDNKDVATSILEQLKMAMSKKGVRHSTMELELMTGTKKEKDNGSESI